jgi:hypothetical protein
VTESTPSVANLLAYCTSLAQEFQARRDRVRHFVQHNLTSGTANEALLRDFLSSISAEVFAVREGFVCNPLKATVSKQCDILVHDTRYPRVYAEGGVNIVWPESVLVVMEVKTTMKGRASLQLAIENIVSAKRTDNVEHMIGLIFAFDGLAAQTALEVLANYTGNLRPLAVILFNQGAIIQQADIWNALRYGGGESPYELRMCTGADHEALSLTYLLLLFLWSEFNWSPGFSSTTDVLSALREFLDTNTQLASAL